MKDINHERVEDVATESNDIQYKNLTMLMHRKLSSLYAYGSNEDL